VGEQVGDDLVAGVVLPAAVQQPQVDIGTPRADPAGMPGALGRAGEFFHMGAGGGLLHG
jgi:hypothetical protein